MLSGLAVSEISEEDFFSTISNSTEFQIVLNLGDAALHSDGKTVLYESANGGYAKITHP